MNQDAPFPFGPIAMLFVLFVAMLTAIWYAQASGGLKKYIRLMDLALKTKKPEVAAEILENLRKSKFYRPLLKRIPVELVTKVEREVNSARK